MKNNACNKDFVVYAGMILTFRVQMTGGTGENSKTGNVMAGSKGGAC
jgi:hypothetical protein